MGGASYPLPGKSTNPVAIAFARDGDHMATANLSSNDITLFQIIGGVPSNGVSYSLPAGSSQPRAIVFVPTLDGSLLIATSNSGSNDMTLFSVESDVFTKVKSYPLPNGALNPQALAASSTGAFLATANSDSNSISRFSTDGNTLTSGTSFALPANSSTCVATAFSPVSYQKGYSYVATANRDSDNISLFLLFGGVATSSDDSNTGIIIGATIGGGLFLFVVPVTVIVGYFLYKFVYQPRARDSLVNFSGDEDFL